MGRVDDGAPDLTDHLVRIRLAGSVATSLKACVENGRRLLEGDLDCTFGLSDWREVTYPDVVAALRHCGVSNIDDSTDAEGTAYVEPDIAVAGIRRHRERLAETARVGGRVLVATGHAFALLPHYTALVRTLTAAGCKILRPLEGQRDALRTPSGQPCSIRYLDGVGTLAYHGALHHTHRPHYMEAMLRAAGGPEAVDLVVGDHGFAGAAVEAGIPTLSIADVNDPGLPLAQYRGRTDGVLVIDDGLDPAHFVPVTEAMLSWPTAK